MTNRLLIVKDGDFYDATGLLESAQWSGRYDAAARSLKVTLLDHEAQGNARVGIELEKGRQCVFLQDGRELFRGMFLRQEQSHRRRTVLTAYDNGIYLANNKDSFSYTGKTASFIFRDVCGRFGISCAGAAETEYIIDELPKPAATGFDVVCDALETTFQATGKRYCVVCEGEALRLVRRVDNTVQWVLGAGENLTGYTYAQSIENTKTRVKLLGRDSEVRAEQVNRELEKHIGIFQTVGSADPDLSGGKLKELAAAMLREQGAPERVLNVDAAGIAEIVSGKCVFARIPHLGLEGSFYVESDSHSFAGGLHTMRLGLKAVGEE